MQRLKNTLTFSYLDRKHYIFNKFHLNRETFDEEQIESEGSSREQKQIKSFQCSSNLLKGIENNPLSQWKIIIEHRNQFVLLVFDSFCHSGVKLIPFYFTNRICHLGARHYRFNEFSRNIFFNLSKVLSLGFKIETAIKKVVPYYPVHCSGPSHHQKMH